MKRFKCIVSYDGTAYVGWQSQTNGNSVQEEIEKVLASLAQTKIIIVAASRTDAKVHALGQTFHFDTELNLSAYKMKLAINGYLPRDIRIVSVEEVNTNFHARYCVKEKTYTYKIHLGEYDVFSRNYAYQCRYDLDVDRMQEASQYFVGKKDFTSFCSNSIEEYPNQIREVLSITHTFDSKKNMLIWEFKGKGFLRYMVRMMMATLIEVGRGRMQPIDIQTMLEAKSKEVCKRNAEPQGLTLESIEYYDLIAQNEMYIVRELIEEDTEKLHSIYSIEEKIETMAKRHREKNYPILYAIAKRHDNTIIGYLRKQSPTSVEYFMEEGTIEDLVPEIKG